MVCLNEPPFFVDSKLMRTGLVSVSGNSASRLPDFTALSKQLALVTPTSTSEADYTPSNTKAQECPATGVEWAASSNLPPVVDPDLCACMLSSLSCVTDDDLTDKQIGPLFGRVCSLKKAACEGISTDASAGVYGPFSMCDSRSKLSFALHQYYLSQGQMHPACDFKAQAKIQTPTPNPSCAAILAKVNFTVASPTATPGGRTKSAAGALLAPRSGGGLLQLWAPLMVAVVAGVAMILL
jgi:hypothetical protein